MTSEHPITPPPELAEQLATLVKSWAEVAMDDGLVAYAYASEIARKTLEWGAPILMQQGADEELDACLQLLEVNGCPRKFIDLLTARRPKPPSLKEQALKALDALPTPAGQVTADRLEIIRRALEQLDD